MCTVCFAGQFHIVYLSLYIIHITKYINWLFILLVRLLVNSRLLAHTGESKVIWWACFWLGVSVCRSTVNNKNKLRRLRLFSLRTHWKVEKLRYLDCMQWFAIYMAHTCYIALGIYTFLFFKFCEELNTNQFCYWFVTDCYSEWSLIIILWYLEKFNSGALFFFLIIAVISPFYRFHLTRKPQGKLDIVP